MTVKSDAWDFDASGQFREARFYVHGDRSPVRSIAPSRSYLLLFETDFWPHMRAAVEIEGNFDWYEEAVVPAGQLREFMAAATEHLRLLPEGEVVGTFRAQDGPGGPPVVRRVSASSTDLAAAIRAIIQAAEACAAEGRDMLVVM